MSISFNCGSCGKDFTVDDKFAGKKGRCRQCGAVMPIPMGSATSGRSATLPRDDSPGEISPSRKAPATLATAARPAKKPAPAPAPPAGDVYGFDDAPLPPRSPGLAGGDEPTVAARARPKKTSRGFFSPGPKKELYPGGPTPGGALKRVIVGIVAGIAGLLVKMVLIPAIQQGADPTWASRRVIESYTQGQVAQMSAITEILRGVRDVPSAEAASGPANSALRKLAELIRSHKDRKGKLTDLAEIKAKYQGETSRAEMDLLAEIRRVMIIPGAWDAMALQATIDELAALDGSGPNNMAGFAPPRFRPPPVLNPVVPPMPRINAGAGPAPGNPPGMMPGPRPGMGPGPGPRPGIGPGPGSRNRGRGPAGLPPG